MGTVRIRNVGYDRDNGASAVDLLITSRPNANMNAYSTTGPIQLQMAYNDVVSVYTDANPASQAVVTPQGFACIGFGLLPSTCASGSEVDSTTALCTDGTPITGRGEHPPFPPVSDAVFLLFTPYSSPPHLPSPTADCKHPSPAAPTRPHRS